MALREKTKVKTEEITTTTTPSTPGPFTGRRGRLAANAGVVVVVAIFLTGCAAGPNPDVSPGGAGFWLGLWHAIIFPVTFVISLFTDTVTIYEVNNDGNWYDAGFVVGLALFSGPFLAGGRGRRG